MEVRLSRREAIHTFGDPEQCVRAQSKGIQAEAQQEHRQVEEGVPTE